MNSDLKELSEKFFSITFFDMIDALTISRCPVI